MPEGSVQFRLAGAILPDDIFMSCKDDTLCDWKKKHIKECLNELKIIVR